VKGVGQRVVRIFEAQSGPWGEVATTFVGFELADPQSGLRLELRSPVCASRAVQAPLTECIRASSNFPLPQTVVVNASIRNRIAYFESLINPTNTTPIIRTKFE